MCSNQGNSMLGEALRLIRVYHDLKAKEVAKKLQISTSYLSEIENGHKTPKLELITKYSEEFSLPISSIMFFAENVGARNPAETARKVVAGKVIGLLKFLEARADRAHAE
jgi:transcriptional regulator with XRE-family HTH domain